MSENTNLLLGPDGKRWMPPPVDTTKEYRMGFYAYQEIGFVPINIPTPEEILESAGIPQEIWEKIRVIPDDVRQEIVDRATQRLFASAQDVHAVLDRWLAGILTPTFPTPLPSTDPSTGSTSTTAAVT